MTGGKNESKSRAHIWRDFLHLRSYRSDGYYAYNFSYVGSSTLMSHRTSWFTVVSLTQKIYTFLNSCWCKLWSGQEPWEEIRSNAQMGIIPQVKHHGMSYNVEWRACWVTSHSHILVPLYVTEGDPYPLYTPLATYRPFLKPTWTFNWRHNSLSL